MFEIRAFQFRRFHINCDKVLNNCLDLVGTVEWCTSHRIWFIFQFQSCKLIWYTLLFAFCESLSKSVFWMNKNPQLKIDENQRQLIFLSYQSIFRWICLIVAPNWDAISGNYTKMKSKPKPIALSDANEWKLVLNGAKFRFWFVNELMRTIKSQLWFIPSLP